MLSLHWVSCAGSVQLTDASQLHTSTLQQQCIADTGKVLLSNNWAGYGLYSHGVEADAVAICPTSNKDLLVKAVLFTRRQLFKLTIHMCM